MHKTHASLLFIFSIAYFIDIYLSSLKRAVMSSYINNAYFGYT